MPRVTREQLGRIGTAFSRLGITRREDRLRLTSQHAGRTLYSSSQLTEDEADRLEERLRVARPELMLNQLRQIVLAEERAAAIKARAHEPAPTLVDVEPSEPVEKPDTAPEPPRSGGRIVGWMCQRSGRGKGCTPITEADVEEARNARAQTEIEIEPEEA
jgi:hypothetical protein